MDTAILSGPGRQLTELAQSLRSSGVELTVITFQRRGRAPSPFPSHLAQAGVPCVVIAESGRADIRVFSRLRRAIDRLDPHIIQTHSYRPAALIAALQTLGQRRRWIAFFHGSTSEDRKVRLYNWLDQRLVRRADRIVVMSQSQLESFAGIHDRVSVVHNAVLAATVRDGIDRPISIPSDVAHPVLGVIGRLSAEKGIDVLLLALRLLRDRGIRCSLLVAGDGPELRSLMALRDKLELSESVHFVGVVHPVAALYPQLDVVVISSHSEGLPNVLLEALAADRSVVATRVGAIPEVLSNPDAGELVEPGSPAALADGIRRALDSLHDPHARAARRDAVDAFSLERRTRAHVAIYNELLHRASSVA
jgi:glycosyltransferase involved in cell wall biosynthesis